MKTAVQMISDDHQHGDWKKGEKGYIDGYVRGGNDVPLVAVVLKDRIVLASTHQLKVIGFTQGFGG